MKLLFKYFLALLTFLTILLAMYLFLLNDSAAGFLLFFGVPVLMAILGILWTIYFTAGYLYSTLRSGPGKSVQENLLYWSAILNLVAWVIPIAIFSWAAYNHGFHNNYMPLQIAIGSFVLAVIISWTLHLHKKKLSPSMSAKSNGP